MGCGCSTSEDDLQKARLQRAVARTRVRTTTISELEETAKFRYGGLLTRVREDVFMYCILPFLTARDAVVNVAAINSAYRGAVSRTAVWAAWRYPMMDPRVAVALALESETHRSELIGLTSFWSGGQETCNSIGDPVAPADNMSRFKFDLQDPRVCQLICNSPMSEFGAPLLVSSLPKHPQMLGRALKNVRVTDPDVAAGLLKMLRGAQCGGVEYLEVSCAKNLDAVVLEIAKDSPDLRALSLSVYDGTVHFSQRVVSSYFDGKSLPEIAGLCPSLVELDVSGCHNLSEEALVAACANLDLQTVYALPTKLSSRTVSSILDNIPGVTKLGMTCKRQQLSDFVKRGGSKIRHLNVGEFDCDITDDVVIQIARSCPHLDFLSIFGFHTNVTGKSIAELGRQCFQLRHLRFESFEVKPPPMAEDAITIVAQNCPHLETLHALGVATTKGLEAVASHCPLLKQLSVGRLENLGDEGIVAIAKNGNLESVTMTGKVCGFSDGAVLAIAQHCSNLRLLNVTNTFVSDAAIDAIAKRCPKLEMLNVEASHCTASGIESVARNCPRLRHLNIASSDINMATLSVFELLEERCPHLEYVGGDCIRLVQTVWSRLRKRGVQFSWRKS